MPAKSGSWDLIFRTGEEFRYAPNAVIRSKKGVIGEIKLASPHYGASEADVTESIKNAYTAAAAPDLYAALKDAVDAAEFAMSNDLAPMSIFLSWINNARQAIEDAERTEVKE